MSNVIGKCSDGILAVVEALETGLKVHSENKWSNRFSVRVSNTRVSKSTPPHNYKRHESLKILRHYSNLSSFQREEFVVCMTATDARVLAAVVARL